MRLKFGRLFILGLMLLGVVCANAQERKKYKELFPVGLKLSPSAYHLGFGVTKMWAPINGLSRFRREVADSLYTSTNIGKGGYGLYLEGGYSRYYKSNSIADNIDVTFAFKQFKGEQSSEGTLVWTRANNEVDTLSVDSWGYFDRSSISLAFTASQHIQLTDKKYYTFGYGVDLNYQVFKNSFYSEEFGLQRNSIPKKIVANLHLRFGYSFYYKRMILMNPSIELPILSTEGVGMIRHYRVGYIPSLFNIRFTWLKRPKSFECPPVKPTRGERAKKKDYLQELFHPDSKRNPVPESKEEGSN